MINTTLGIKPNYSAQTFDNKPKNKQTTQPATHNKPLAFGSVFSKVCDIFKPKKNDVMDIVKKKRALMDSFENSTSPTTTIFTNHKIDPIISKDNKITGYKITNNANPAYEPIITDRMFIIRGRQDLSEKETLNNAINDIFKDLPKK